MDSAYSKGKKPNPQNGLSLRVKATVAGAVVTESKVGFPGGLEDFYYPSYMGI